MPTNDTSPTIQCTSYYPLFHRQESGTLIYFDWTNRTSGLRITRSVLRLMNSCCSLLQTIRRCVSSFANGACTKHGSGTCSSSSNSISQFSSLRWKNNHSKLESTIRTNMTSYKSLQACTSSINVSTRSKQVKTRTRDSHMKHWPGEGGPEAPQQTTITTKQETRLNQTSTIDKQQQQCPDCMAACRLLYTQTTMHRTSIFQHRCNCPTVFSNPQPPFWSNRTLIERYSTITHMESPARMTRATWYDQDCCFPPCTITSKRNSLCRLVIVKHTNCQMYKRPAYFTYGQYASCTRTGSRS